MNIDCSFTRSEGLFAHSAVDAVFAGSGQQQCDEGDQEDESGFAVFQRLSFQRHKGGYGEVDDKNQGCEAREQAEGEEAGANDFREDAEDEGPAVSDVEEIVERVFQVAEMDYFSQTMVKKQEQSEEAKDEDAEVEGAVGALRGEEFFHVRFGIFAKLIVCRYL